MGEKVSRPSIIFSIIKKDFFEFFRDKVWFFLTILSLVMFVTIFWISPNTVDESLNVGVYQSGMEEILDEYFENEEGLEFVEFNSPQNLRDAIKGEVETEEEVNIGLVFPDDFLEKIMIGEESKVQIYTDASVPKEIRNAMESFVGEITFVVQAFAKGETDFEQLFPVQFLDEENIVLGEDRLGEQIPTRERLKPLFAFFLLLVESMALASLIALEIHRRTITAILATGVKLFDLMAAKAILGTLLAFSQAFLVLLLIGAIGQGALILLAFVLLGAIMVMGISFISGASGKDFMGTLFYSVPFLFPLLIPAVAIIFPGTVATWITWYCCYMDKIFAYIWSC